MAHGEAGISANRLELLQIADAVAREKSIDRKIVIAGDGGRDPEGGQVALRQRERHPLRDRSEDRRDQARARAAKWSRRSRTTRPRSRSPTRSAATPTPRSATLIAEPLPPLDFGRVAAQNAKQVIVQKVREAERERQYDEYKDRVGEIVNGTVKRVEYGNVIVDLGRAEGIIRRDEMIPRENFRYGDRIRAYIYDVRREQRGPQIFLSRAQPEFMAKLFAQEVPEIYDGIVEIKSVARDPGSRAKIAVISQATLRSIRSAPASACAAAACRRWSTNCRARRSTSSSGTPMRRPSSSTRWRRPK